LLATACGSKDPGSNPSMCTATVPPPAGCDSACDPTTGAPSTCADGFHCSSSGKCDISCTQGGNQCGPGFVCTSDGSCLSDGTGSGDVPIDAADCPKVMLTAARVVPVVQLLLDQSGSMDQPYPNAGDPQRWDGMHDALVGNKDGPPGGVVKALESSVIFGSTLYTAPDSGTPANGQCLNLKTVPRALNNFAAIRQQLDANGPGQNTPTGESIAAVVADFTANPPADPTAPKIIVLATDGLPDNCQNHNPDEGAEQNAVNRLTEMAAQSAFSAGFRLFFLFVGTADTETVKHAKRMANAGAGKDLATGTEPFFEATNPAQLTAQFNTIIGSVVSCDATLSSSVSQEDAPLGIVTLNGNPLVYNTDWSLDADGVTLHLKGAACTTFKTAPNATVSAEFPCGTIIF